MTEAEIARGLGEGEREVLIQSGRDRGVHRGSNVVRLWGQTDVLSALKERGLVKSLVWRAWFIPPDFPLHESFYATDLGHAVAAELARQEGP